MATQGANYSSTVVDDSSTGTISWTSPTNAQGTADASFATVTLSNQTSHWLKATNFGFSIPDGVTINGITCEYDVKHLINSGAGSSITRRSRIVKGGTIGSTVPSPAYTTTTTLTWSTSGSDSYLWGDTWTATDINSSDFGTAINFTIGDTSNLTFSVDAIRITITYSYGDLIFNTTNYATSFQNITATIDNTIPVNKVNYTTEMSNMGVQILKVTKWETQYKQPMSYLLIEDNNFILQEDDTSLLVLEQTGTETSPWSYQSKN